MTLGSLTEGNCAAPVSAGRSSRMPSMIAYVVVATKGRARETLALLDRLERQSLAPSRIVVIGTEAGDLEGLCDHPSARGGRLLLGVSTIHGSCAQRNLGTSMIEIEANSFVAYMDDDFRPADTWLASAAQAFEDARDVVGLTGQILADGVNHGGLSEDDADGYLSGRLDPRPHWASGMSAFDVGSVYGCNMAFRDVALQRCAFDEELVLYGWQEDRDYTGQARRLGRVVYEPACRGVHLGVASGRTSGVRFGYSQIANLVYLARKGTTDWKTAVRFVSRHLASNLIHSIAARRDIDYRGRLFGNAIAVRHLIQGRARPRNAATL